MKCLPQIALKFNPEDGRSDDLRAPSSVKAPSDDRTAAARKAAFHCLLISDWVAGEKRRIADALTRKEIAEQPALDRLLAQHQSLMDNFSHYFASTERADVALGVLLLITFLCDNRDGCCTLSIPRIAKFFRRSERAISEAVARLEKAQAIFVERKPHSSNQYWPVINRAFGGQGVPAMWFVDARAPSRPNGRPRTQDPEPDSGGLLETPRTRAQNPLSPAAHNLSSYLAKEKKSTQEGFEFSEEGALTLHGALREQWLGKFHGCADLLSDGLVQAAPYLARLPKITLADVRSQLTIAARMTPKPKPSSTPSRDRRRGLAGGVVSTLCASPDASGKIAVYRSKDPDAHGAWVQYYENTGAHRMASLVLKTGCILESTRMPPPVRGLPSVASGGAVQ